MQPDLAPQQASNSRDQDGHVEWLRQVLVRSRFKPLQNVFWARTGREHEQGNIITRCAQCAGHGEPIFSRQHHIQNERIEIPTVFQEQLQRLFTVAAHLHGITLRLQVKAKPFGQMCFIFHDQDPRHTWYTLGRRSVNVLPRPAPSLWADASPPWRRAMDRTMNNPRPVPFTRPDAEVETL